MAYIFDTTLCFLNKGKRKLTKNAQQYNSTKKLYANGNSILTPWQAKDPSQTHISDRRRRHVQKVDPCNLE